VKRLTWQVKKERVWQTRPPAAADARGDADRQNLLCEGNAYDRKWYRKLLPLHWLQCNPYLGEGRKIKMSGDPKSIEKGGLQLNTVCVWRETTRVATFFLTQCTKTGENLPKYN
jgi:hypothetical protein